VPPLLWQRTCNSYIGRGFESCLGTIVQVALDKLLTPVTKQYNLVLVKRRRRSEAEKVTMHLVTRWSFVTDLLVYPAGGLA